MFAFHDKRESKSRLFFFSNWFEIGKYKLSSQQAPFGGACQITNVHVFRQTTLSILSELVQEFVIEGIIYAPREKLENNLFESVMTFS
jgi:hypothetical protein